MAGKKFLITGATGATGGHAIKTLLELNMPVRALVHGIDARSERLKAEGVEIVQGDLSDFEAVNVALKGITGAYFVYPIKVPGILEATVIFAQAALEQGVGAIVNMSQISARRIAKSHGAQSHWIADACWIARASRSHICGLLFSPNGCCMSRKVSARKIFSRFPLAKPAMHR